jgi:hypothetical protein
MANARCYYRRNTLACPSDCSQLEQYLIVPIKLSSASWVCWQLSISLSNWPAGVDVYLPSLTAKASSTEEAFIVMTLTSELTGSFDSLCTFTKLLWTLFVVHQLHSLEGASLVTQHCCLRRTSHSDTHCLPTAPKKKSKSNSVRLSQVEWSL